MTFTVTPRHSGNSGTTSAQTLTTGSATPTADSLLIVAWGAQNDANASAPTFQTPVGGGLTYTAVGASGDLTSYPWSGDDGFRVGTAVYRATVGPAPSAFAVTVDSFAGTPRAFYGAVCFDVTGHDPASPIVTSSLGIAGASKSVGDSESGTVTLAAAPAVGNLVVVVLTAGADSGGGFAVPTAGAGKAFSAIINQNSAYAQSAAFYRVWDGTESLTITCADLGDSVGNYSAVAFEIAAAERTEPTPEEHSGSLALSGSGSLFYISTPSVSGALETEGSGSLTLSGRPSFGGSLGLSGSGSLSRAEEPHTAGALDLDGSGVLSASGAPATSGALDLDGSGVLASATSPSLAASLALSGSGSLSTDGTPATSAPLALSGAGHLALSGNGAQSTGGTLEMSGSGSLALSGRPSVTASLPLDGVGALSRSGHPATSASLALAGAGTLRLSPATPTEVVDLTLSVSLDTARFVAALDADRFRAVIDPTPQLSAALADGGWSASLDPNPRTGAVDA